MILNASINTITRGDAGRTSRNWLGLLGLERMFCGDFESSSESSGAAASANGSWLLNQATGEGTRES
jgi:hypothetical protein